MSRRAVALLVVMAWVSGCADPARLDVTDPDLSRGAPPPVTSWTQAACPGCWANAVFGRAADDVYAVGALFPDLNAAVFHYDGQAWSTIWQWTPDDPSWGEASNPWLTGMWVDAQGTVYAIALLWEHIYRFKHGVWGVAEMQGWISFGMTGTPDHGFAGAEFGVTSWTDGTTWKSISFIPDEYWEDTSIRPDDIFGAWGDWNRVFAVGATGFRTLPCSGVFPGVHGGIHEWDGTQSKTWIDSRDGLVPPLNGVWGSSFRNVFAVGEAGTILRFNGRQWTPMNSGTDAGLCAVWGSGPTNVYAVGGNGTIRHFDGASWSGMNSGVASRLNSVWGTPTGEVFVAAGPHFILHGTP